MPKHATMTTVGQHAPAGSCTKPSLTGPDVRGYATPEAHDAWLHQATKAREAALRLLLNRFTSDIEAARELFGGSKPADVERQAEYARKLTADYLAESEKLFELIAKLNRHGFACKEPDLRTQSIGATP